MIEDLKCEICDSQVSLEEYQFCDICPDCRDEMDL
jgi:hypothetical protein